MTRSMVTKALKFISDIHHRLSHELTNDEVPVFTGTKSGFEMEEKAITYLLVNGE